MGDGFACVLGSPTVIADTTTAVASASGISSFISIDTTRKLRNGT